MRPSMWWPLITLLASYAAFTNAAEDQPGQLPSRPAYSAGQPIPVSCLNRTIDTGEHITNAAGELQYIPFPVCNETGRPLELHFGVEQELNCTIAFVDDSFFHLLEIYVHNDAPLTCRIPSCPLVSDTAVLALQSTSPDTDEKVTNEYIPLIFALTGTYQRSHLHISNNLNVLLHAAPKSVAPGVIDAATAYSVSYLTRNTKVIIGDALPLRMSVRWYPTTQLPSGWSGIGGHLFLSTLVYCLLSAGAATAICVAYFRGIEFPRRLRSYGRDKVFARMEGERYSGYGYGGGAGNGFGSGVGKKD